MCSSNSSSLALSTFGSVYSFFVQIWILGMVVTMALVTCKGIPATAKALHAHRTPTITLPLVTVTHLDRGALQTRGAVRLMEIDMATQVK